MKKSPLVGRWLVTRSVKTSGEISPTDVVLVIASNKQGERAVFPMKWGDTGKSLRAVFLNGYVQWENRERY